MRYDHREQRDGHIQEKQRAGEINYLEQHGKNQHETVEEKHFLRKTPFTDNLLAVGRQEDNHQKQQCSNKSPLRHRERGNYREIIYLYQLNERICEPRNIIAKNIQRKNNPLNDDHPEQGCKNRTEIDAVQHF